MDYILDLKNLTKRYENFTLNKVFFFRKGQDYRLHWSERCRKDNNF